MSQVSDKSIRPCWRKTTGLTRELTAETLPVSRKRVRVKQSSVSTLCCSIEYPLDWANCIVLRHRSSVQFGSSTASTDPIEYGQEKIVRVNTVRLRREEREGNIMRKKRRIQSMR